MANNPYAGSVLYLAWVYSGGTVELHPNFRSFTWATDLNFIDATAGADAFEVLLASYGTGQDFSATSVAQVNGSVLLSAMDKQTSGTVIYGPEGTATGKIKYSIPAISKGPSFNQPYNDVNEITLSWRQSADASRATF